jgi:hypothetical protein
MLRSPWFALVVGALLAACGAPAPPPDSVTSDDLSVAGAAARDVEADADPAGRQAHLADLLARATGGDTTPDRDGDGIADSLEELLIRRYRPYYRFSQSGGHDEDRRPADAVTEVQHAQLKKMSSPGNGVGDPVAGCGRKGDFHLDPPASLLTCDPNASFAVSPAKSTLCLNIDNDRYGGVSFAEAKAEATGFYAHVANDVVNGHPAYKIEYWQFFAFNNQDITVLGMGSYGDHEGDWTSVQVWFDRTEQRVAQLLYLIHGKSVSFHMPAAAAQPACRSCMIAVKGAHYDPNVGNFLDAAARPAYDDNEAEFFVDGSGFKHVVVYIERGGHEFWPGAWGHAQIDAGPVAFHLNPHNGEGTQYLVPDVAGRPLGVGEVDRPLTPEADIVLSYNGHWGCTNDTDVGGPVRTSPIGPAIHCSWKWPARGPVAACEH